MYSGIATHPRIAYAASAWAFAFAGITFYWAAGGTVGASTVGNEVTGIAASNWAFFSLVLWADSISKVLLGLLALALAQSWGRLFPGRFLLLCSGVLGFAMAAYAFVQLAVTGTSALLMKAGIMGISSSVDWTGIIGHLVIWDPYWLLGGILFLLAAQPLPNQARTRMAAWFR